ncbi:MAG: hypothetical protein KGH60_02635 [Candidatus Micrarchaeota archaeon]|nr:hypothetical protein [Candidatus Micrarchaeota archaeon]
MAKDNSTMVSSDDSDQLKEDVGYSTLRAVVKAATDASVALAMKGFETVFKSDEVRANIDKGIMTYFYAAGILSFCGREINRENITRILEAIDIEPNNVLTDVLLKTGLKSHIVYAYAYYYLLINGKSTTDANIMRVIDALGLEPDKARIKTLKAALGLP